MNCVKCLVFKVLAQIACQSKGVKWEMRVKSSFVVVGSQTKFYSWTVASPLGARDETENVDVPPLSTTTTASTSPPTASSPAWILCEAMMLTENKLSVIK